MGGRRPLFDSGFFILVAVTLAAGAGVLLTRGADRLGEIAAGSGLFLLGLAPKVLAGVFIAAALPVLIPRDRVAAWVGRDSGLRGLALALVAGAVVPGGPSVSLVLAGGFLAAGADLGAVVAYTTSWSLLSLHRTLIWEYAFLPADLVSFRLAGSAVFPLLAGLGARWLARRVA